MPESVSASEYLTVDQARKILDLSVPMLYLLVERGRVRTRVAADGRLRLAQSDLRDVMNTLDLAGYHELQASAPPVDALPEIWQAEARLVQREWTGHTPEDIWRGERAKWARMGRTIRTPRPGRTRR